jgi:hypothetical protein
LQVIYSRPGKKNPHRSNGVLHFHFREAIIR